MNSLYIIGPVAGKPNDNKEAFVSARRALKADGFACAIPHDYIDGGTDWNTAMRISITAMLSMEYGHKSKPSFDGIALLDGWEESEGAKIEKQLAEALGIPCRPWRDYLNRDHTPENCERSNLVALCAPCHLRADKHHHVRTRKRRAEERRRHMAEHERAAAGAS